MLPLLSVAIGAPSALADSFTYTYTDTQHGITWTTKPISTVTTETFVAAADLTATSTSGPSAGCAIFSVLLNYSGIGGTETTTFCGGAIIGIISFDEFTLTDYGIAGTYQSPSPLHPSDTLVVTAAAAPEPGSVGLMLLGIGLMVVMRKRRATVNGPNVDEKM
jgi:hypothetical protein